MMTSSTSRMREALFMSVIWLISIAPFEMLIECGLWAEAISHLFLALCAMAARSLSLALLSELGQIKSARLAVSMK
jgi:hypothetical protein